MTDYPRVLTQPFPQIEVEPGVFLYFELMESNLPSFYMIDFTVRGERGREWEIRRDNAAEDFRDAWIEFLLLHEARRPKPVEQTPPTGKWVDGEDGFSTWVSNEDEGQAS